MNVDKILQTINAVSYENIDEVAVPVNDLVKLRTKILELASELKLARKQRNQAISDGLKILSKHETVLTRLDEYA